MRDEKHKTVFISHASEDEAVAGRICGLLEARGVSCWMAPRDVAPGHDYMEAIAEAIIGCSALLLLLSENANRSRHVASEVERAFSRDKRIIPVRLGNTEPCQKLEVSIGSSHRVDWGAGPIEATVDRIVQSIGEVDPRPAPPEGPAEAPAAAPRGSRWNPRIVAMAALGGVGLAVALSLALAPERPRHRPPGTGTPPASRPPAVAPDSAAPSVSRGSAMPLAVPRYHALVIGINKYSSQPDSGGWNTLATAEPDAEALAEVLEKQYGFAVQRLLDGQATRAAIIAALDQLATTLTEDDALLLFFAGHGFYDPSLGEGYWIPSDARKSKDDRLTKEDWIWNSTVTRLVGASRARHVLIIADSCYGGSLFRGDGTPPAAARNIAGYWSALATPSRYLIASGGLEPVPDGADRHSAFARQILDFLGRGDRDIFSASEIGGAARTRLNAPGGQTVQMGPLALAANAGGEFVFVKTQAVASVNGAAAAGSVSARPAAAPQRPPAAETMGDAAILSREGATNTAHRLLASLAGGGGAGDSLLHAVSAYVDQERRSKSQQELRELIKQIEAHAIALGKPSTTTRVPMAKPRIIACLGPAAAAPDADTAGAALLFRICLRNELEEMPGEQVIEREAIEQVLQEMQLGSSSLADSRAGTTVGRLLPASLILLGDLLPGPAGGKVYLRLVDTETTRVLGSFSAEHKAADDLTVACQSLATQIVSLAIQAKPLLAKITLLQGDRLHAGIGSFQGLSTDMRFEITLATAEEDKSGSSLRGESIGQARPAKIGETDSEFAVEWLPGRQPQSPKSLWLRERF